MIAVSEAVGCSVRRSVVICVRNEGEKKEEEMNDKEEDHNAAQARAA